MTATTATANTTATTTPKTSAATALLPSLHQDYILATALDVYGRRLATASGDRCVRVWDLDEDGQWCPVAAWQAHRGPVTAVDWAHPEFGTLLATVGTDQEAKIWEELQSTTTTTTTTTPTTMTTTMNNTNNISSNSRWILKASLTEARRGLTCCEFAPRHWGLKLATGSADGAVRLYEAVDVMNLAQWPLAATLDTHSTTTISSATATSTNTNTPSSTTTTGTGNTSSTTTATTAAVVNASNTTTTTESGGGGGCTALSWCTGRFDPPTLAAVGGRGGCIFRYSETARAWQAVLHLPSVHNNIMSSMSLSDVAWAPNVGRRYHTLAVASAHDGTVTVYRLNRNSNTSTTTTTTTTTTTNTTTATNSNPTTTAPLQILSQQEIANVGAWRCQWNVTGTVLATSGDGGRVRLFKADHEGLFRCVAQIQGELSTTESTSVNAATTTSHKGMGVVPGTP